MHETPKVFQKKSKVNTWFNGLAREVLTGEDLPVSESSVAAGNTVTTFQGYLSLPSDDSGSEVEIAIDGLAEIRQQFQLLQAQLKETKKELADIKQIRINHSPRRGKSQQHRRHRTLSEE